MEYIENNKKKNEINNCDYLNNIEVERIKFAGEIEKKNQIVFVTVFIFVFLFLIAIFFIKNVILFFIFLLFSLTFLSIMFFCLNKKKAEKENIYFSIFFKNLNSFIFGNNENINFMVKNNQEEEDKKIFFTSNVFNNIFYFKSQNSIDLKVNNFNIKLFDCVAQKKTFKKLEYLFVGKCLVIPNNYQFDNEIVIYLFGDSKNIDFYFDNQNFIKFSENKESIIFVKNKKNIPNHLIEKIINIFNINDILTSAVVFIKKNKTYFYLSYISRCLLNPPLNQEFVNGPVIKFKNDLQKIIDNLLFE